MKIVYLRTDFEPKFGLSSNSGKTTDKYVVRVRRRAVRYHGWAYPFVWIVTAGRWTHIVVENEPVSEK